MKNKEDYSEVFHPEYVLVYNSIYLGSFFYNVQSIMNAVKGMSTNVPRLCDVRNRLTQCFRVNECNKIARWFKVAQYPLIAKPLLGNSCFASTVINISVHLSNVIQFKSIWNSSKHRLTLPELRARKQILQRRSRKVCSILFIIQFVF